MKSQDLKESSMYSFLPPSFKSSDFSRSAKKAVYAAAQSSQLCSCTKVVVRAKNLKKCLGMGCLAHSMAREGNRAQSKSLRVEEEIMLCKKDKS